MKSGNLLYKFSFFFFKLANSESLVRTSHCAKRLLSPPRPSEVGVLVLHSIHEETEAQAV